MRHRPRALATVLIGALVALQAGAARAAAALPRSSDFGSAADLVLQSPIVGFAPTPTGNGYWLAASDGGIFNYGDAHFRGSAGNLPLRAPIVGFAPTPTGNGGLWPTPSGTGNGYWLAAADGGIFTYGDADFHGSAGNLPLRAPIVGFAPTPTGNGYWLAASDGGIFNYGDAHFRGSAGNLPLRAPIVGFAPTPTGNGGLWPTTSGMGNGYWLAASDGGIFNYGDADFYGSAGNLPLRAPIVGFAPTPTGNGYWLAAADGGIFTYGDADFHGSAGNLPLRAPIVGFAPTPTGNGYWLAASDGGIFTYGDAHYFGSAVGLSSDPVVGIGASNDGLAYWSTTAGGEVFAFDAARWPTPAARRTPTRADPLRVLITGDSVAITLQDGLDTALRSTGRARAIRRGRWCYGLTASFEPSPRKVFCAAVPRYAPHMLSDDITETDPDAVVLMLGAWDWQGRKVGSRVLTPPSGEWWKWYEGLIDDAFRRLTRKNAIVYWVGYPGCDGGLQTELERTLNASARRAAWRNPTRAVYLDLHEQVCPDGPLRNLGRLPDGRRVVLLDSTGHFSATGAEYTGRWITEEISNTFGLPVRP